MAEIAILGISLPLEGFLLLLVFLIYKSLTFKCSRIGLQSPRPTIN